ncbi:response regulator transcription factor, partial [Coprobacillus cateniformis]|nr:response regulator transcription factor [Coprobacillus cateniformis]
MDGIQMTMKVRENYDFPIIMLSAKSEDIDKITGLNIGADDYVTKPFVPMELLARVSSQLRRYSRYLNVILDQQHENSYVVGGLELNLDTKQVTVEGKIIKVTPIEFKILQLLMEYPGKVFSADNIYESVWQEDAISTDTVMVHVRNLREKIEIDPKNPRYLKVVWGVGYKIEK